MDNEETPVIDRVRDTFWGFLKFALMVLFLFWLLLEIFFSREVAKGTITMTESDMRSACPDVMLTDGDRYLVDSLQMIVDSMRTGEIILSGKNAEDFGRAYIPTEEGEPSDIRTAQRFYFNKNKNCGYVRYKWGLDWIVQLEFKNDGRYICKSVECYSSKFNGNVLVYAWNHTIARFLWHHPRYLSIFNDRGTSGVEREYERQTIGHYWFSFLGDRIEQGEMGGFVSGDIVGQ